MQYFYGMFSHLYGILIRICTYTYSGHVLYSNNINKYLIFSLHSPYKLLSLTDILCHKISLSL